MKVTTKGNYRVVALLCTTKASTFIADLGGWILGDGVEITFRPRRPGDIGSGMKIPDTWVTRDNASWYEQECADMVYALQALPYIRSAETRWDETYTCASCGLTWEEIDQDFIDQHPTEVPEGHGVGTPLCCEEAISEWEASNLLCTFVTGGTYEVPPDVCTNDRTDGTEFCSPHLKAVTALERMAAEQSLA